MKNQATNKLLKEFQDKMQGLDPKVWPLLWGGALAVFIIADLFLVMSPQWSGVVTLCKNVGQIHQDIDTLVVNKQRMGQFIKQRDDLTGQMANVNKMVYLKEDLPRVLQKISTLANRNGVQIDQIIPQKEAQALLCQNEEGKYYAVPVTIQAHSGFHKFEQFLSHLETEHVFWQVDLFSFVADAQYPQRNQVKFLIKVIVLDKG